VLEKPRFGAFHGTDLELILPARGVDSVILGKRFFVTNLPEHTLRCLPPLS
jgi:hypothetical protein